MSTQLLVRRQKKVVRDSFNGKTSNEHPRAYVMAGPQGSGKSTKAKALLRSEKNFVYVNPDSTLMALNGGRRKLPDDDPELFDTSQRLTERVLDHAVAKRLNICLDTSIPSPKVLTEMQNGGYDIKFVVMTTPAQLARSREVNRDLTQLNWGRPGIPSVAQAKTAADLSKNLSATIERFADSVVTCENSKAVMSCTDDSRIKPSSAGPNVSIKANQKRIPWLPSLAKGKTRR